MKTRRLFVPFPVILACLLIVFRTAWRSILNRFGSGMMSAEVSFTKRAAAELSRCFNGLTVNRAGNSSTVTVPSSHHSSKKSTSSSTGSTSGPSTSSSIHSTSSTTSSTSFLLHQDSPSPVQSSLSKHSSSKERKEPESETTSLLSSKKHQVCSNVQNSSQGTNKSSSPITIMKDGISIPNSVQILITKANTTLSPFKHHSSSNHSQVESSFNGHFAKGCKSSSSKQPSTPRRAPPPPAPRKTSIARRKNFLLSLQKPVMLQDLARDFNFLHHFFGYFTSKERTVLAQVSLQYFTQ